MVKKKRFGISSELSRGFSETINTVENNESVFRNAFIPFSRIELDPNNPRKLHLDINDIKNGLTQKDPYLSEKESELESIKELALTIESAGLINPIVVYKLGDSYRVVAGERRCLASIVLGKTEIEAKVYNEKPNHLDLKLIQWVENNAREDLTLYEKILNISDIRDEFLAIKQKELTVVEMARITGISKSQSACYLSVLKGPKEVLELIKDKKLNNLDKASLIANAKIETVRKELIVELLEGKSIRTLRQEKIATKKQSRSTVRVNMGFTKKTKVIKIIANALYAVPDLQSKIPMDKGLNWDDPKASASFFRKLVQFLETCEV